MCKLLIKHKYEYKYNFHKPRDNFHKPRYNFYKPRYNFHRKGV